MSEPMNSTAATNLLGRLDALRSDFEPVVHDYLATGDLPVLNEGLDRLVRELTATLRTAKGLRTNNTHYLAEIALALGRAARARVR